MSEELARLRFFGGVPGWALERLAESATKRRLEQGALVVQQNDEPRAACFLLSGAEQVMVCYEAVGGHLLGVHREPRSLTVWRARHRRHRHNSSMRCEEPTELIK